MELQTFKKDLSEKKEFLLPSDVPILPPPRSLISSILFLWTHALLFLRSSKSLSNDDTLPLFPSEKVVNEKLTGSLQSHRLFSAIIYSNLWSILKSLVLEVIVVLLEFTNPIFMQLLLAYLSSDTKDLQYGIGLAVSFTVLTTTYPVLSAHREFISELIQIRVRNSLYNVIYNKTLSSTSLPEGLGINLLQVDVEIIEDFFGYFAALITLPLEIIISAVLIYQQVGNAVFVAIGIILVAMLGNVLFSSTCKKSNEELMKIRDNRIENSTQLLTEIKMIKAYNWQHYFSKRINGIRAKELGKVRFLNILESFNRFCFWTLPSLTLVAVMLYYTYGMQESINSEKVFVTLTTIFYLTFPLLDIPNIYTHIIQLLVSQKRIQDLIDSKPWAQLQNSGRIALANCSFGYGPKAVLKDITLKIQPHEFLAVIGPVGSGKSSLLLSLMGETQLISGDFLANTNIAYAPSMDSWIINGTLKQNILMGRDFREEWYWKVVDACSLVDDFQALAAGDATEIGERGINLSGGQKARVCLARAVYADKEVLLMDDPLSSVDNRVADSIFSKCFEELLKDKVRVLVTHRHSYLDRVDRILHMKGGSIQKISSIDEEEWSEEECSIENIDEELEEIQEEEDSKNDGDKKSKLEKEDIEDDDEEDNLIEEEDRHTGVVDKQVYIDYVQWSGGYTLLIIGSLCMLLWLSLEMLGDITLKDWSLDPENTSTYLPIFVSLRILSSSFMFFRFLIFEAIISIRGSFESHKKLLSSLIHAPINLFYDITPTGRILNRLSKDLNVIDEKVGQNIGNCISSIVICIGCMSMGIIFFPYLIFIVPLIVFPGKYISKVYIDCSRELTRLESISRSPILSQFQETLSGVKHIRVFNQCDNFIKANQEKIDTNTRINYSLTGCRQWMQLYLELLSALLIIGLYCMAVVFRGSVSAGIVGLSMSYLIPLPTEINQLIINSTELENVMVSVERVKKLSEIPSEQPLETEYGKKHVNWPVQPRIEFKKVYLKYRPNTEIVLKGLSFLVPAGARVGIAGRTGSGKSSIFLALLRIVELEKGLITIDGINIALLGLKQLRESITLIPQDPLVFNGTMKDNLDPLSRFTDQEMNRVLDEVQLHFGLDHEIKNSGANISIGERQLLSLCRALICNTRILLFDEATAGVDPDTDARIQSMIKNKFGGCSILTIAHRIDTIKSSDIIILIDDGKVLEIGTPEELGEIGTRYSQFIGQKT